MESSTVPNPRGSDALVKTISGNDIQADRLRASSRSPLRSHTRQISSVDIERESIRLPTRRASISPGPVEPRTPLRRPSLWRTRCVNFMSENRGIGLMVLAQFFGAAMAAVARLLEIREADGPAMHPFQVSKHWKDHVRIAFDACRLDPLRENERDCCRESFVHVACKSP